MPRFSSIYQRAKHQRALWTMDRASPLLWIDCSDRSTLIADSDGINTVKDKSIYKQDFTQSNNSLKPKITTAEGLPAILFDGANDVLTAISTQRNYQYPFTALFLASTSSLATAYNCLFDSYQDTAGTKPGNSYFIKSNGKSAYYGVSTTGQPNYDGTGSATYYANEPFLFAVSISNGLINSWKNDTPDYVGTQSSWVNKKTPFGTTISIGAGPLFGRYTPWTLRECVFIPCVCPKIRNRVSGAMLWKRGLQRLLPASHKFRNRPPLIGD
jgi:hypothetical protein